MRCSRFRHAVGPLLVAAVTVLGSHTAFAQVDLAGQWQTLPRNQDGSGMTATAHRGVEHGTRRDRGDQGDDLVHHDRSMYEGLRSVEGNHRSTGWTLT